MAQPKKGLGKGLGSLLGEDAVEAVSGAEQDSGVRKARISDIEPNPNQPRRSFDDESLAELADSIRQHGLIQPLAVRRQSGGLYQIVAGERRWRAARLAGLSELPVVVVDADDARAAQLALVENLQREDLNPVDEAMGYRYLIESYGLSQEEAADIVGKSRPAVTNSLRLLSLSGDVLALVEKGALSAGHARALVSLKDEAMQLDLANKIISSGLSVRSTEQMIKRILSAPKPETPRSPAEVNYLEVLQTDLSKSMGRRVRIVDGRRKGRIELEYYGKEDLNKLTAALSSLNSTLHRSD